MQVVFVEKLNGPERLVCDAEIVFEEGPLAGMKLVGFSLWRSAEGDMYVTFPSRAFGTGHDRKYFDYIRPIEPQTGSGSKKVKDWILASYKTLRDSRQGETMDGVVDTPPKPSELLALEPEPIVKSRSVLKREAVQQGQALPQFEAAAKVETDDSGGF